MSFSLHRLHGMGTAMKNRSATSARKVTRSATQKVFHGCAKMERFVLVLNCHCDEILKSVCKSVPSTFSSSGSHLLFFEKD